MDDRAATLTLPGECADVMSYLHRERKDRTMADDVEREASGEAAYVAIHWFGSGSPAPSAVLAGDDEPDEDEATVWWCAAHELSRVEEWTPFEAVLEDDDAGWPDLVQVPELELLVHSARLRDAVESVRADGDTHAWLPVRLRQGDDVRDYAVLNVWGQAAEGGPGQVDAARAAGRTVVLPAPGDGDPAFAVRVRVAAEAAGIALPWGPA